MASSFINCPADQWTLIAAGVTTGTIHRTNVSPAIYLQAIVPAGGAAPTTRAEGVSAFKDALTGDTAAIKNDTPVDVYLWPDIAAGSVRVDT